MQFFVLLDFASVVVVFFVFVCLFVCFCLNFNFSGFGVLAGVLKTLTAKQKFITLSGTPNRADNIEKKKKQEAYGP